jgi:tetratricopeptide (TPR) repeat protein
MRTPRRPRLPVVGCLVRLAVAVVLLVALGVGALFLVVGRGGVGGWVTDVGQSVGVAGGVPAQTQRGIDAYRAGDDATAERELAAAADAYRSSALALLYLAEIRMKAGDVDRAGEYLEEAVRREPESAIAHRQFANYWVTRARRLRAQRSAASGGGAPANATAAAAAADADAAYRAALREYDRAYELDPSDQRGVTAYGCVLAEMGDRDTAEQMLAQVGSSVTACR